MTVVKEALAQLGLCGRDVRPPSRVLPGNERDAVTAILRSWSLPGLDVTDRVQTGHALDQYPRKEGPGTAPQPRLVRQ